MVVLDPDGDPANGWLIVSRPISDLSCYFYPNPTDKQLHIINNIINLEHNFDFEMMIFFLWSSIDSTLFTLRTKMERSSRPECQIDIKKGLHLCLRIYLRPLTAAPSAPDDLGCGWDSCWDLWDLAGLFRPHLQGIRGYLRSRWHRSELRRGMKINLCGCRLSHFISAAD